MTTKVGIGWVPATSETIRRLQLLVPAGSVVVPFTDEVGLIAGIASGTVAMSIVEGGGSTQALAVRTIRRVRETFPVHPILAWCDLRAMPSPDLLDIARAGAQELIRDGHDEVRVIFSRILASAMRRAAGAQIADMVNKDVPRMLRPVFEYAVEHASEHLDRDEFAAAFGISRRTLHNRLINAGFPPTRTFLTWCRLLVATAMLDQPGHTLDSVAGQLGFYDGHNLGVALKRYSGSSVTKLRKGGVLHVTVHSFLAKLAEGRARINSVDDLLGSLPETSTAD